jgi:hypothetical protein
MLGIMLQRMKRIFRSCEKGRRRRKKNNRSDGSRGLKKQARLKTIWQREDPK